MTHKKRFLMSMIFVIILTILVTTTAFAHYCTPPNKMDGAGSIGTYNVVTETFEPSKRVNATLSNGGFVTITDGATFSYDIFAHQGLPAGALAAGPGGDDQCDGVGIDYVLACLGIPSE
jgi:hypothetical protein